MSDPSDLSRRERQIMDAVYSLGEATVKQVVETIPDPPTSMSVRRLMQILVEKGQGKGREVSYRPRKAKAEAGQSALQGVLETFFGGSLENAVVTHLVASKKGISAAERKRLMAMIEQSKKEGN